MKDRKYIIKNLAPWMMDELLAFSAEVDFDLILLRKQKEFYDKHLDALKENGVTIYIEPYSNSFSLKKLGVALTFFLKNIFKFGYDYNMVVGMKSLVWFMKMDMSLFSKSSNIHAQFATQAPLVALLIKKYYGDGPRITFTFHAYDIYYKNHWFKSLTAESEGAFSISSYNINYIKENYQVEDKIVLSRLGVFRRENSGQDTNGRDAIFTIGLLSWFLEKKGIIYLLEAIHILSTRKSINLKLLLAGDGELKDSYIEYIEKHDLHDYVEFVGTINSDQKSDFFNKLDAFVMPSIALKNDQDGIPVVIMEALDYDLPIISTDVSGIPEICINDYNGKLVPERDPEALANAIEFLHNNQEKTIEFGRNSKELSNEYDIEINSKKKLEMIEWV